MAEINTALISVYDKTGLDEFAKFLASRGVRILSTGGTLTYLRDIGVAAEAVSDYTGQPEILGGRVKTLHPMIFGGILARRSDPEHAGTLRDAGIHQIDIVAVNLYPFTQTIAKPGVTLAEAIEQIDIGGVSLLRAAAKNFRDVYVASEPRDYAVITKALDAGDDELAVRRDLARKAFQQTSAYDAAIGGYLAAEQATAPAAEFPARIAIDCEKLQDLRYGENPHQQAAFYRLPAAGETSVATAHQLQGKELSYNNIIDLDSALEVVRVFDEPACCIIKHNNPCGVARAEQLLDAYKAARDCDPVSAFGGVIGFNREVDAPTAQTAGEMFVEAIIAPGFAPDALQALAKKKNLRLLATGAFSPANAQVMLKSVVGGVLAQTRDLGLVAQPDLKFVTKARPSEEDVDGLLFAWRVAKFVKSNAIVYTSRNATIGIGAGQMSRIDSTNIAAVKAQSPIRGAYMASDAFFPFRDNVDRAADIGIRAIIQPGGSVRDEEVIAAADEHQMIMVFTGMRHFRH
jgi:phosphoribosylaminoimidazolecarboxamide formyltransferase / IMP cyclohydrolase